MIIGGHVIIQSSSEPADKAFFRDVLKMPHVDAGGGFLLFALPPSEFAVHETASGGAHEFYLMCDDMEAFLEEMEAASVATEPPQNHGWGTVTAVTLPGGGKLRVYQPHHARPHKATTRRAPAKKAKTKKAKAKKAVRKPARRAAKTTKKKAKRGRR